MTLAVFFNKPFRRNDSTEFQNLIFDSKLVLMPFNRHYKVAINLFLLSTKTSGDTLTGRLADTSNRLLHTSPRGQGNNSYQTH